MPRLAAPERRAPSGFPNLMAPCSAQCLLAMFQARSALGVLPSEPCSSRAAAHHFWCLCPLDIREAARNSRHRSAVQHEAEASYQTTALNNAEAVTASPAFKALLHTRICHLQRRIRPRKAHSSPGIHPLQGVLPRWNAPAFTGAPLVRLLSGRKRPKNSSSGCRFQTR
jgi:hypothetical protein